MTGILAKLGVENMNPDFATFARTIAILLVLAGVLLATGKFQSLVGVSGKSLLFLVLSGIATGALLVAMKA